MYVRQVLVPADEGIIAHRRRRSQVRSIFTTRYFNTLEKTVIGVEELNRVFRGLVIEPHIASRHGIFDVVAIFGITHRTGTGPTVLLTVCRLLEGYLLSGGTINRLTIIVHPRIFMDDKILGCRVRLAGQYVRNEKTIEMIRLYTVSGKYTLVLNHLTLTGFSRSKTSGFHCLPYKIP